MTSERLHQLEKMYAESPSDPFNIYALAIEYLKLDQLYSLGLFEKLLKEHPQYLPTYYHAGQLYEKLQKYSRAKSVYQKGMEVSLDQRKMKTNAEIKNAYQMLTDE